MDGEGQFGTVDWLGRLSETLERPDLRPLTHGIALDYDDRLEQPFRVDRLGSVTIGPAALIRHDAAPVFLRHALERAILAGALPDPSVCAVLAARTAALYWQIEAMPDMGPAAPDYAVYLTDAPPIAEYCSAALADLARFEAQHPGPIDRDRLERLWPLAGPAEYLMATGGDVRLRLNPSTGLNAYGCSHRPRPWAVTFASSTASSVSERGYAAAEHTRRAVLTETAHGGGDPLAERARAVATAIRNHWGIDASCGVILAPSGTDGELFALALARHGASGPFANILMAPEETGSGVAHAAAGHHFAATTALGVAVDKATPIAGFGGPGTRVLSVRLREPAGALRVAEAVDADCETTVEAALAGGGRAMLHILDVSKTGLLAPGLAVVDRLRARYADRLDVLVDACQARLGRTAIAAYLARGFIVLITGSKFFTGPPFAGALLVPRSVAARLDHGRLAVGLADYAGRAEWQDAPAAADLPARSNYGLILRWVAALTEMAAYAEQPPAIRRAILERFSAAVCAALDEHPLLLREMVPPASRADDAEWQAVQTIHCFKIADPAEPQTFLPVERLRRLYRWLNDDLSEALPAQATVGERLIAGRRCHIGQPVPLGAGDGQAVGALRIAAGARLVSGEPSLAHLGREARLAREIADALGVIDKLDVLLRYLAVLEAAEPPPLRDGCAGSRPLPW